MSALSYNVQRGLIKASFYLFSLQPPYTVWRLAAGGIIGFHWALKCNMQADYDNGKTFSNADVYSIIGNSYSIAMYTALLGVIAPHIAIPVAPVALGIWLERKHSNKNA